MPRDWQNVFVLKGFVITVHYIELFPVQFTTTELKNMVRLYRVSIVNK